MRPSSLASFISRLRRFAEPRAGGLDDAELLDRFAARRDEAAFEVLLWRYGPLVLALCRRMLRREQDVEDAFQATFLTLLRKAGSIARRQSLGAWLHTVAFRIGLQARARAKRDCIADQERVESAAVLDQRQAGGDWQEVIDQEIQRLPRRYRLPFILCYLDGKTHVQTARLLSCPPGTVASRLAWARDRLRARLTARGLTLPSALTCLIVPAESQAASLAGLIETALRTARLFTLGTLPGSGTIPAHVTAWSKGVVRAMFLSKVQVMTTLVLASALLGAGGVLWQRVQAGGEAGSSDDTPVQAATQQKPKNSGNQADTRPRGSEAIEGFQKELAIAEAEYKRIEKNWDDALTDYRRHFQEREKQQRAKKARLAFEAKRTSRALEMAESRYEKLTHALDVAPDDIGLDKLQKKQREAQQQAEQLGAKLLEYELELAAADDPTDPDKPRLEALERQRTLALERARKKIEAIERRLLPAASAGADTRLQELGRKIDALTRAVEDLSKSLRR